MRYFSKTPFFKYDFVSQYETPAHNKVLHNVPENFTNQYFFHNTCFEKKYVFREG